MDLGVRVPEGIQVSPPWLGGLNLKPISKIAAREFENAASVVMDLCLCICCILGLCATIPDYFIPV
jgi:hypothetical protein